MIYHGRSGARFRTCALASDTLPPPRRHPRPSWCPAAAARPAYGGSKCQSSAHQRYHNHGTLRVALCTCCPMLISHKAQKGYEDNHRVFSYGLGMASESITCTCRRAYLKRIDRVQRPFGDRTPNVLQCAADKDADDGHAQRDAEGRPVVLHGPHAAQRLHDIAAAVGGALQSLAMNITHPHHEPQCSRGRVTGIDCTPGNRSQGLATCNPQLQS